jgi:Paired amphipathic helix repeat
VLPSFGDHSATIALGRSLPGIQPITNPAPLSIPSSNPDLQPAAQMSHVNASRKYDSLFQAHLSIHVAAANTCLEKRQESQPPLTSESHVLPKVYLREITLPRRHRPLVVEDALEFLERVRSTFEDEPETYRSFMAIMRSFREQSLTTAGVMKSIIHLFGKYFILALEFNVFLPEGYSIHAAENTMEHFLSVGSSSTRHSLELGQMFAFLPLLSRISFLFTTDAQSNV